MTTNAQDIRTLKKDAYKAIFTLLLINLFVVFFAWADGLSNNFVIAALVIQAPIIFLWIIPFSIFQVAIKRQPIKLTIYQAFAAYKHLMEQVNW